MRYEKWVSLFLKMQVNAFPGKSPKKGHRNLCAEFMLPGSKQQVFSQILI